ncbi:MAG TPA: hypothetical protein VIH95_07520 [Acidimicrobiales bacterium]
MTAEDAGNTDEVTAEDAGNADEVGQTVDPRAGLPADERALLEAFDRLQPQGTVRWAFDDAVRRLIESPDTHGRPAGWGGLPADLWERGRGTKASERVLGDVVKIVAQDVTEYTDRAVKEALTLSADALTELRVAVRDAVQFLSARVELLESSTDPLGLQAAALDLPVVDVSAWVDAAPGWASRRADLPVLVGELSDDALVSALAGSGATVDGVDPRGAVVWAADAAFDVGSGPIDITFAEVIDHLRTLPESSRGCVILSGSVDRTDLAGKVALVDEARRVVAPGGNVVLLVTDQAAWDASLDPVVRDLLPGRPLHPETWRTVLALRGLDESAWLRPAAGSVHAVVAEVVR